MGCSTGRTRPAARSRAPADDGWESFVGAGPMPMRHGLHARRAGTLVRAARCSSTSRHGRRDGRLAPAAPRLRLAARRARLGQPEPERAVCRDGALLSRHRDDRGHDALRGPRHHAAARALRRAGPRRRELLREWRARAGLARGRRLRPCWFEPTFHKHAGSSAPGIQIHVDDPLYHHATFRPWRLSRCVQSDPRDPSGLSALADFPYEYETSGSRSTSSTAARASRMGRRPCARRRPTSTRWRAATRTSGNPRSDHCPGRISAAEPPAWYFSVTHVNAQPQAARLAKALEAAGLDLSVERADSKGGSVFSRQIEAALESSDAVLVLWSKASIGSDWVLQEAARGRAPRKLVPVSIYGTEPPLGFRHRPTRSACSTGMAITAPMRSRRTPARRRLGRTPRPALGDRPPPGRARVSAKNRCSPGRWPRCWPGPAACSPGG